MEWLLDLGYLGLFLGTFAAGTILTFSSDVLILGMLVAGGDPWICLACATLGNGSGALVSYAMAWFAKWEWIEKWLKVRHETLVRYKQVIDRWGVWCAFFSWAPFVGQMFMLGLGFFKVRPVASALVTYLGCLFRFLVWVLLYIRFGDSFVEWLGL